MEHKALDIVRDFEDRKVKLALTDIDGILRGKVISAEKFMAAAEKGFGFCDVVIGWDAADVSYDNVSITGWHTGYPDAPVNIDLDTVRTVPWDEDIPFFLCEFADGPAADVGPRRLLKRIRQQALDAGFQPYFAQEFEWFNFAETPRELHDRDFRSPRPLTPGMFGYSVLRSSMKSDYFHDIFDGMAQFGVPLEGLHTETGPGVYEAAITYDDVLEAADRAVLFKTGVKEIAYRHEIMASFMAKWSMELPGCSGHVHSSLWDKAAEDGGKNLFSDPGDPREISGLMKSYMAGILLALPQILPMFAPTVNSYKRLVEGAWAPTTLTWGTDNRTVALRVLQGGQATRLEHRVPGSDVNPYLAMSAVLAAGLYGIRNDLSLDQPATVGNGYRDSSNGVLPGNLWEATQAMKDSELARELFGEAFVDHFTATREWEWRQFGQAVTDWEFRRYFEII